MFAYDSLDVLDISSTKHHGIIRDSQSETEVLSSKHYKWFNKSWIGFCITFKSVWIKACIGKKEEKSTFCTVWSRSFWHGPNTGPWSFTVRCSSLERRVCSSSETVRKVPVCFTNTKWESECYATIVLNKKTKGKLIPCLLAHDHAVHAELAKKQ